MIVERKPMITVDGFRLEWDPDADEEIRRTPCRVEVQYVRELNSLTQESEWVWMARREDSPGFHRALRCGTAILGALGLPLARREDEWLQNAIALVEMESGAPGGNAQP